MRIIIGLLTLVMFSIISFHTPVQTKRAQASFHKVSGENLHIDVHQLEPGKVRYEDVAKAHAKDLAVEKKYGVHFINYWFNEEKGLVFCLSSSNDSESIRKTHAEVHGLLPEYIYQVTGGTSATLKGQNNFSLDQRKDDPSH